MPRPTDIAARATPESRRKGALAANAKRRALKMTLREHAAEKLEQRAEELVDALVESIGSPAQMRAAVENLMRALRDDLDLRGRLPEE